MDDDVLNMSVRKFLKQVGVTSQRVIEQAVRQAAAEGRLKGRKKLRARMTLAIAELGVEHEVAGDIACG